MHARTPLLARSAVLAAASLLFVSACSGDGPTAPRVDAIALTVDSVVLPQRGTTQIVPTAVDANGTLISGVPVTFTAEDTRLVTVSSTGMITSVGPAGTTAVTLTAARVTKRVPVTVTPVPATLSLAPNPGVVAQRATLQLTATVIDLVGSPIAGVPVTFASSNEGIVTVSPTGLVTSVGPAGVVTITARADTMTQQTIITVAPVPTSIAVTPASVTVGRGGSMPLTVRVLDTEGAAIANVPVTYTSQNTALATVSSAGVITAGNTLGTTAITVRAGTISKDVPVTVVAATHPAGTIAATTPLAGSPWGAAIASDGTVYVAQLSGGLSRAVGPGYTAFTTLAAPTGWDTRANAVALSPDGGTAYVSGLTGGKLAVVNTATGAVLGDVTLTASGGSIPFDVVISADGRTVYVSNDNGHVYVVDAATRSVVGDVTVGGSIVHLALDPTRPVLYASGSLGGQVAVIDLTTNTVVRSLQPPANATGSTLQAVAVSPDGRELYVADERRSTIEVFDLGTNQHATSMSTGCSTYSGPYGLAVTPDGAQLYAACPLSGTVAILDRVARTVTKTLSGLGSVRRVSVSPDGALVVVPDEGGRVYFIR